MLTGSSIISFALQRRRYRSNVHLGHQETQELPQGVQGLSS